MSEVKVPFEDEEVIYVKATKKWERVGDVVNERNTLAERLKSCEETVRWLRTTQEDAHEYIDKLVKQNDQLKSDLANLNAMHQQLASVLHDDDMPTVVPIANVVEDVMGLRADLDRARADLETLKRVHKHCCKPCGAPDCDPYKTLAQSNARLTAALVSLVGCPNMTANIEAAKSVGLDHLTLPIPLTELQEAQAALKETPAGVAEDE